MKKQLAAFLIIPLVFALFAGCNGASGGTVTPSPTEMPSAVEMPSFTETSSPTETSVSSESEAVLQSADILVVFFSHSGNTRTLAQYVHDIVGGDMFEIVAVEPYPENMNECVARATAELADNARPSLASSVEDMGKYAAVYIGYPIWCGNEPMVIRSFLEAYDFTGKTIYPFCTSGSSTNDLAVKSIRSICPAANVADGLTVTRTQLPKTQEMAAAWLDGLKSP